MGMEKPRKGKKDKPKDTGWRDMEGGQSFIIQVATLKHPNCSRLSPHASKLLLDLARQHSGSNNGYLHPGYAVMKKQGWKSAHTLHDAIQELVHYRIIVQTVQGGKNKPSYYGFTFRSIVERPKRPFDCPVPIVQPSQAWKDERPDFVSKPKRKNKSLVQPEHKVCAVGAQVNDGFVQQEHKQAETCAVGAQVRPISDGQFVHSEHSYIYINTNTPCGNAAALGSAPGSDSALGLEFQSLKKNGPNQIEGNLALVADAELDCEEF